MTEIIIRCPDDWFMEDRLKSLLNPDKMHPVGCSSWDAEAHAFLELLAESIVDAYRTNP